MSKLCTIFVSLRKILARFDPWALGQVELSRERRKPKQALTSAFPFMRLYLLRNFSLFTSHYAQKIPLLIETFSS